MSQTLVKSFYATEVRYEWRRLVQDAYHNLELLTTLRYLEKYLPKEGHILDAGGGPGRYTMELAQRGYRVTLLDLTPENVAFAGRMIKRRGFKRRAEAVEGSITDLSRYADGTFDGVVCTGGPISHILDAGQRATAIRELLRVAKPEAPVFISVMSRLSVLVVELMQFQHETRDAAACPDARHGGLSRRLGLHRLPLLPAGGAARRGGSAGCARLGDGWAGRAWLEPPEGSQATGEE